MTTRGYGRLSVLSASDDEDTRTAQNGPGKPDDSQFLGVDLPPRIARGQYLATALDWRVGTVHGRQKLTLEFEVEVPDSNATNGIKFVMLERYYNMERVGGRWRPTKHGDYTAEWILVAGRRPARADRMAPSVFLRVPVLVEVVDVITDRRGNRKPNGAEYSKVGRIVEVVGRKASP